MGKRSAVVELFLGDMGSIQRELRPSILREDQLTMETKLEQIAVKARREPNLRFTLAGPSHHARPGAGESIKDSEAIRRRGGWSDGGGGEGELRGLDRAGAPIHPPPGISRA